jgi:hypothetical protein
MMLNAKTFEYLRSGIVAMNRNGNADLPLWIKQPASLIFRKGDMIGNLTKLLAGHFEYRTILDRHIVSFCII